MQANTASKPTVHVRSIALPTEHGGWGFVSEPILLGLLVAPSFTGLLLATATMGVFLIRQPLKLYIKDRRSKRDNPRMTVALRFITFYALITIFAGLLVFWRTSDWRFLLPILFSAPFAIIQFTYDARNQSRALIPEITGAVAISAAAPAIAMLGGWTLAPALGLWLILSVKAITSVLYVRSRLRLERDKPAQIPLTLTVHVTGLLMIAAASLTRWIPLTVVAALLILNVRAFVGLSRFRKPRPPKIIGFQELAYGFVTLLLTASGYWFTRP